MIGHKNSGYQKPNIPQPENLPLHKERNPWYNVPMDDLEVIQPPISSIESKRLIAELIRSVGKRDLFVAPMGEKMPYAEYLAVMLWDAVTEGKFIFANGDTFVMEDYDQWLKTVRFLSQHLDGGANLEVNTLGVNIFKVYLGIDESKV